MLHDPSTLLQCSVNTALLLDMVSDDDLIRAALCRVTTSLRRHSCHCCLRTTALSSRPPCSNSRWSNR